MDIKVTDSMFATAAQNFCRKMIKHFHDRAIAVIRLWKMSNITFTSFCKGQEAEKIFIECCSILYQLQSLTVCELRYVPKMCSIKDWDPDDRLISPHLSCTGCLICGKKATKMWFNPPWSEIFIVLYLSAGTF